MVILFIWILLSVSLVIGCIKVHNTIIKGLFGVLAGLCITVLCFVGIFYYLIVFKVSNVDTSVSSDGEYSLTMQAVGEPLFFGSADGQFILKKGEKRISKVKFSLRDDGGNISQDTWHVTWKKNQVEIIIYGEEQNDEQFLLFFDGKYKINELNTKYGKTLDELNEIAEEQTEEENTKYDEDGYPMTEEYQRYKKELAEVSDYIQTKSDVFLDSYPDTKYQLEFRLTSKGWPFAVINKKIDENTGAVTELHLLYNESHIDEETDEYVLQEYYYDSDNTEAASPVIVDFFLIQKDTLKVTDENTKEWH
ncbi:hypothetical protein DXB47_13955 [Firmicutes bacterium OM04-13BH]|nr:hypothetical protein DW128_06525 [Firmicutes bacterium AM10-47]RHV42437.1 hypothetical protein DXB47_13955 [Firmicutes bacterium OM04-13BH]